MFKPHPQSRARKRSAITLIKRLLAEKEGAVLPTHRQELLSVLLWKITLAESSKYKTRFQSLGALRCSDKRKLRHDHVFQRSKMIADLEKARANRIDSILKNAFGCTVTIEEHDRLCKFAKYDGWLRYRKARIGVKNTETGKRKV